MTAETGRQSYARYTEPMNFFDEPAVKERVDRLAARAGKSRSDILRELVASSLSEREAEDAQLGGPAA